MSALATIIVAEGAVYAYLCLFYLLVHAKRRADREFLYFALLSGSLAVYAAGAALLTDAPTLAEGDLAMRLQLVGAMPGLAFFCSFAHEVVRVRRSRVVIAAYLWCGVGLAVAASGLGFDPDVPVSPRTWGFAWAPHYQEPALQPLGLVFLVGGFLFATIGLSRFVRPSRTDRELRWLLLGNGAGILASAYDIFAHATAMRTPYLSSHAAMISNIAVGYLLLARFVRTSTELERTTRELRASYDELTQTQEELLRKEQLATVGELSAVIAHEVRNPLAIIKNAISGLRREALDPSDRNVLLGILDEETDRLNRLVGDLLSYAKPSTPDRKTLQLADIIARAMDLARRGHPKSDDVQLDVQLDGGPLDVIADPDMLRQAFANVLENALQAMPTGGTITVRSGHASLEDQSAVAISFVDTGEGMDTLVRAKARDPFFTTRPSGTGLGLAIVDRLVRAHGGTMDIESRAGIGTTITLVIPEPIDRAAAARVAS